MSALIVSIILFSLLNVLGGRGLVPGDRFIFRCLLMGAAVGVLGYLYGLKPLPIALAAWASFGFWFPFGWGQGFMAVTGRDSREPHERRWIYILAHKLTGYGYLQRLTYHECKRYGAVFMSLSGMMLYPLFIALAYLVTPWALLIGLGCALQGLCYLRDETPTAVAESEASMGAVIGLMVGLTYYVGSL